MPAKPVALPLPPGLDAARMPRHVAVIMDGNGRWARARGLPRLAGHKRGVESVREIVRACSEMGVPVLTLYAFSTENWLRPRKEVEQLMRLLAEVLRKETLELDRNNVRLRLCGRPEGLPRAVREELQAAERRLENNDGLCLNMALNYGARQEIAEAVNRLIEGGASRVSEEDISGALDTAGLPDPDLVVRTSGELRLSNFLLWQSAYAEFHVTDVLWPDFRREHLIEAIRDFQSRDRRFGGL